MVKKEGKGLYMISVAAKLAGMHPQTLRMYEQKELIYPSRSIGSTRLYSDEDIDRLKYIQKLTQAFGINLAGVKMIFDLNVDLGQLRKKISEMERHFDETQKEMECEIEKVHKKYKKEIVLIPKGKIMRQKG